MWFRLKALFAHSRTVLAARLYTLAGTVVGAYDGFGAFLGGQDFTPITTRLLDAVHVPPDMRPLALAAFIGGTGELFVYLRKITTQSLADNKVDSVIAADAAQAGIPSPPAPDGRMQP